MRYLWFTSIAMVGAGAFLIAAYLAGAIEVIALIAGVLLLWSGIVKVIVLRIWRSSLSMPGATEGKGHIGATRPLGRQTQ
jgi:hypothetical protein